MDYLTRPIAYLDGNDFDDEGNLINPQIPDLPVFIMFQANFCGYCKIAKPAFQEFAKRNQGKFFVATVQADSEFPEVRLFKTKIQKIYPNLIGFPSYLVCYRGKKIIYSGGRKLEDLQNFADGFNDFYNTLINEPDMMKTPIEITTLPTPSPSVPQIPPNPTNLE
jgi:thiol-disulfide isomerase/thioredoxin